MGCKRYCGLLGNPEKAQRQGPVDNVSDLLTTTGPHQRPAPWPLAFPPSYYLQYGLVHSACRTIVAVLEEISVQGVLLLSAVQRSLPLC